MAHSKPSLDAALSAADIMFSCTICQETLSSIYAEHDDNRGLRKSGDPRDGTMTKLWLTECAHLSCAKHFEGGGSHCLRRSIYVTLALMGTLQGVPFHSEQQMPRAPCPLCTVEKNDYSKKSLFYVNGTLKGEFDNNIPEAYFQTPPVQFSDENAGLEALRVCHPPFRGI